MKIDSIRIKNFKSIEDITINPKNNINFLIGQNGSGKSNILEAIQTLGGIKNYYIDVDNSSKEKNIFTIEMTISEYFIIDDDKKFEQEFKMIFSGFDLEDDNFFTNHKDEIKKYLKDDNKLIFGSIEDCGYIKFHSESIEKLTSNFICKQIEQYKLSKLYEWWPDKYLYDLILKEKKLFVKYDNFYKILPIYFWSIDNSFLNKEIDLFTLYDDEYIESDVKLLILNKFFKSFFKFHLTKLYQKNLFSNFDKIKIKVENQINEYIKKYWKKFYNYKRFTLKLIGSSTRFGFFAKLLNKQNKKTKRY